MMGHLNEWSGDRMTEDKTGGLGILGENENGKRRADCCAERKLCVGAICISSISIY